MYFVWYALHKIFEAFKSDQGFVCTGQCILVQTVEGLEHGFKSGQGTIMTLIIRRCVYLHLFLYTCTAVSIVFHLFCETLQVRLENNQPSPVAQKLDGDCVTPETHVS